MTRSLPPGLDRYGEVVAGPISHMYYADDSGELESGWIVYGWIELDVEHWDAVLAYWLSFRRSLVADYAVPVSKELHTTEIVNGRRHLSTDPPARFREGDARWKQTLGREVAMRCLVALSECPHIEIGVAYLRSARKGTEINHDRELAYTSLVSLWDSQLRQADSFGVVGMDGDGSDPIYYNAHRSLDLRTRHIIEDPMFHSSRRSQWTQMADLVAWTGFAHLNPHGGNEFAWGWYGDHLADRNPMREPIDLSRERG